MDLSTLEIIGLAFLSGLKVGEIIEESEEDDENETTETVKCKGKHCKEEKESDIKIEIGKIEGENAKKFIQFIEKNLNNKEEK